jgi:hypothetical protein
MARDFNSQTIEGNSDTGVADAGYPIKVGGVYHVAAPTFTDGQRGDAQIDNAGRLLTNAAPTGTNPASQSITVGAAAVQLPNLPATRQVTVRSKATNTQSIYIGPSTVTANTNAATDGLELTPNNVLTIPVSNANLLYAIAGGAGQTLFILAL